MNDSQAQLDYLREYTPDVVAALTNLGQAGAYYDANGHYARTQPQLLPFALNGANQLTTQFPLGSATRACTRSRSRCPGSAVQPLPTARRREPVPGC